MFKFSKRKKELKRMAKENQRTRNERRKQREKIKNIITRIGKPK
jgi:hypothetical protein